MALPRQQNLLPLQPATTDALIELLTPLGATATSVTATARPGRWYDASPTLSFALKCLMLAPSGTREQVVEQLGQIIGTVSSQANSFETATKPTPKHARGNDDGFSGFWQAVNAIKVLPEARRQHAAEFILEQLDQVI